MTFAFRRVRDGIFTCLLAASAAAAGTALAQQPPPIKKTAPEKKAPEKSNKKDEVVLVEKDDPEMTAAMSKAKSSLPEFWKTFDDPKQGEENFALKVAIRDENGTEYFWVANLSKKEGKTFGEVNNDPNFVKSVKLGQRIEVPPADVCDWTFVRDGKMHGNYTMRALFKKLPPAQVEALKRLLADP